MHGPVPVRVLPSCLLLLLHAGGTPLQLMKMQQAPLFLLLLWACLALQAAAQATRPTQIPTASVPCLDCKCCAYQCRACSHRRPTGTRSCLTRRSDACALQLSSCCRERQERHCAARCPSPAITREARASVSGAQGCGPQSRDNIQRAPQQRLSARVRSGTCATCRLTGATTLLRLDSRAAFYEAKGTYRSL